MATKKVLVRVPKAEGLTLYRRAGLVFHRGQDNVVEVDEKQLAQLEADTSLAVGAPPKDEPKRAEK